MLKILSLFYRKVGLGDSKSLGGGVPPPPARRPLVSYGVGLKTYHWIIHPLKKIKEKKAKRRLGKSSGGARGRRSKAKLALGDGCGCALTPEPGAGTQNYLEKQNPAQGGGGSWGRGLS